MLQLPTLELDSILILVKVKVTLRLAVSQSVSLGVEPHLGLMTRYLLLFDSYGLVFFWGGGALSDKRTGLSFVHATGPCQPNLSRVRVLWDSTPYFTVSDLRLPFSWPPTTRGVTVDVSDLALFLVMLRIAPARTAQKTFRPLLRVFSLPGKRVHKAVSWQRLLCCHRLQSCKLGNGSTGHSMLNSSTWERKFLR
jgi:hypothetical protein